MVGATNSITGLIAAIPGTNKIGPGPLEQGGFGPDFIVELGRKTYGDVPGYTNLTNFNQAATSTLRQQAAAASQTAPIFSEKQAQQIRATISAAAQALNDGNLDEAKKHTQELLKRDVNDPIGTHLLGRIAAAKGDMETAISHFERAAQLAPTNSRFVDDLFNARMLRRGDREVLETANELVKNKSTALRGLRLSFQLASRTAIRGEAYLTIAQGFEKLDMPVQQLGALGVVLEEGTEDDLVELESKMKKFIDENEPVGLAYSVLGRTQQKLGKFEEAIQSLEEARSIAPIVEQYTSELANVYASIGNARLGEDDFSGAEYYFNKAHDLDPLNDDLSFGLAAVYVSEAKDEIDRGRDIDARAHLGRAKSLLGDDQSLDGEIANAYYRLGQQALDDDMKNLAILDFENAHDRNPDLVGLERQMADLYRSFGQDVLDATPLEDMTTPNHESVVDNFQKAFDLFSSREDYKSSLADALNNFGLKLMNENQDYEQAVEMFGRAKKLYPNNATYQSNYLEALQLKIEEEES